MELKIIASLPDCNGDCLSAIFPGIVMQILKVIHTKVSARVLFHWDMGDVHSLQLVF